MTSNNAHAAGYYRSDVDGLRAVAVTSVVLFHASPSALPGGFLGVDIFFVISGYLIGTILLKELSAPKVSFWSFILGFYARRARRILPALFAVIVISLCLAWAILTREEMIFFSNSAAMAIAGVSNIQFWRYTDYFGPGSNEIPLLMTWSLGVEEQFYFIVPLLIFGLMRLGNKAVWIGISLIFAASLMASAWLSSRDPSFAYYMLPTRAWELAAGVLLALWHRTPGGAMTGTGKENIFATLGAVLLIISFIFIDEQMDIPGFVTLAPIAGTVLLIHFRDSWFNRRVLSFAPMVGVGLISYSWYLWHWPLMAFVRVASPFEPAIGTMLMIAVVSGGMGYLSWRYIEQPFRRPQGRPLFTIMRFGTAASVIVATAVTIRLADGAPERLPALAHKVDNFVITGRGECRLSAGELDLLADETCRPPGTSPAIALIGDSHASALGPGLKEYVTSRGYRLIQISKSACRPILGTGTTVPKYTGHAECVEFAERAISYAENDPSIELVILSGRWKDVDEDELGAFQSNLELTTGRLVSAGKSVLLVGDVPYFNVHGPKFLLASGMPMRASIARMNSVFAGEQSPEAEPLANIEPMMEEHAQNTDNVQFKSLRHVFCDREDNCSFSDERGLLFIDWHHLSLVGSKSVDWSELGLSTPGTQAIETAP
ncbi:acyltransferase family protein [Hyphomonas neptunium ATCC 15444]|uniref:Acyltransferase family protein n=2 Tax=Hyphomonas TaxID=85 RepID=Q0BZD5_HYPNA|nr:MULTISPECIES: acyltransferase family protein [Hyphomonas]ABI78773.1 acyltransferase family protein [Hyphomonas neptunium ATCC 15444]KCZ95247.1 acyltransferase family protein [Hyphomonas hirschiana VP5]